MSSDYHWRCGRKRAYEHRDHAVTMMRRLHRRDDIDHPVHPYRCPVCGEWHLGGGADRDGGYAEDQRDKRLAKEKWRQRADRYEDDEF